MYKKSYHRKTKALAAEISRYKDVMSRLAALMRLYGNLKPFYKLQKKLYKRIQNRVDKLENLLSRQKTLSVYAKSKESSPVSSDTESVPVSALKTMLNITITNILASSRRNSESLSTTRQSPNSLLISSTFTL